MTRIAWLGLGGALLVSAWALADEHESTSDVELTPDTVLVTQGEVEFTVRDFDAASKRIPDDVRPGYMANFNRVVQDLTNLLALKVISERARQEDFLERPDIQAELAIVENQLLAGRFLDEWVANQPEPDYEQQARERYLLNREDYQDPETVDVSHILIKPDIRSDEEARKLAEEILEKAKAGDRETFKELAKEYSEDRGSATGGGLYQRARRDGLVKPFSDAAFTAKEFNVAFGPVKTDFGYHIMMVHERYPPRQKTFDEVKNTIIPGLREAHKQSIRRDYMNEVKAADKDVNEEAIRALRDYYAGDVLEALRNLDRPDAQ